TLEATNGLQKLNLIVVTVMSLTSFSLSVAVEAWTLTFFYMLGVAQKSKHREDLHLLFYAVTNEALQICVMVGYILSALNMRDSIVLLAAETYVNYTRYVQWFACAVFLLVSRRQESDV
ncbi:hypothetical protein AAVH_24401, partial [Aphelenchoides avenae]